MTPGSLLFVTGNKNKFAEAQNILKRVGITIEQYPTRPIEIQSNSLIEIARDSCRQALLDADQLAFVAYCFSPGSVIYQLFIRYI